MLNQSPAGGSQSESLVVTDKSDSVSQKRSRSRRRKKPVRRKMNSTHDIGLLTTQENVYPTQQGLDDNGDTRRREPYVLLCGGATGGVPGERDGTLVR